MPENTLKRKLAGAAVVLGANLQLDSPWLVEMVSLAGFDYVMLDGEHGLVWGELPRLVLAADAAGITVLVRVPSADRGFLIQALESGAGGVMVPMVESAAQAQAIVREVRYAPLGLRGFSTATRAARWGRVEAADLAQQGNAGLVLALQLESHQALEQAEQIAAVDGIDVLFVGPADLAQSMGIPGRDRDPAVREAMAAAARRVRARAGDCIAMGTSAFSGDDVRLCRGMGYQLFLTGSTHVIRRSLEALHRDLASGRKD